jgi:hypothetical protein
LYSYYVSPSDPLYPGNVKIEIVDSDASGIYDDSDNYFSVVAPSTSPPVSALPDIEITNITPTTAVQSQITNFTATVKNDSAVNITTPFAVNLGGTATTIPSLAAGQVATVNASFGLTILGANQVCAVADIWGTVTESNESNNTFCETVTVTPPSAAPSITVLSPNGGEVWHVGETHTITWSTSNLPADTTVGLQLSYQLTNGATYEDVIASYLNGTGSYQWTIPSKYGTGMNSNAFKMRAILYGPSIAGTNGPQDYSNAPFTIALPTATTSSLSITNISGIQSSYQPNQSISFTLNGTKTPSSQPATSAGGFNVQTYVSVQGSASYLTWANGSYNSATGLWQVTVAAPSTAGTYNMSVSLYCSQSSICGAQYPAVSTQVTKNVAVTVTSPTVQNPVITSISPSHGGAGATITIFGTNLSGAFNVGFYDSNNNSVAGITPASATATSVTFTINNIFAANVPPRTYQIQVQTPPCSTPAGCISNRLSFTVDAPTAVPTVTLSAKPTTITAGSSTTLTWSSTNAVSCAGTSAGSSWTANGTTTKLSVAGSQVITPVNDPSLLPYAIVYNITCTGSGGTSAPVSVTVTVTKPPVACPLVVPYCPYGGHSVIESNGCSETVCNANPGTSPVPLKLQASASDTSNQTAIIAQSLQGLLNQLSALLKSL